MNITARQFAKTILCESFKTLSASRIDMGRTSPTAALRAVTKQLSAGVFDMLTLEGAVREAYAAEPAYLQALKVADFMTKVERLVDYLQRQFSSFEAGFTCRVPFEEDELVQTVDLVGVDDNGVKTAIVFSSKQPYSSRARIFTNKPENAPELLVPGPECIKRGITRIALYSFTGKDDKGAELKPYEHRPEKNVVVIEPVGDLHVLSAIKEEVLKGVCNCDSCYYDAICHSYDSIRSNDIKEDAPLTVSTTRTLTDSQQKVVNHTTGKMAVLAVPGAGKTFSLVERLVSLVQGGVKLQNILLVTFTRKAAGELMERIASRLSLDEEEAKKLNVFTFNGLGYQIIRDNPSSFGKLAIAGTTERRRLIEDLLPQCSIRGLRLSEPYGEHGAIARIDGWFKRIRSGGRDSFREFIGEKYNANEILAFYDLFAVESGKRNYIDYDDQIKLVLDEFKRRPELAKVYSMMYRYVMVDEAQDMNLEQVEFTRLLAQHGNLVMVGDDDQAIYRFRGGDNKYIKEFAEEEDTEVVVMNDNFRCNDKILKMANELMAQQSGRLEKKAVPHLEASVAPLMVPVVTIDALQRIIKQLLGKYHPGDITVLTRVNSVADDVYKGLTALGYNVVSPKEYLREDAAFLLLYDLLKVASDSACDLHYMRLYRYLEESEPIKDSDTPFAEQWNGRDSLRTVLSVLQSGPIAETVVKAFDMLTGSDTHPVLSVLLEGMEERRIETLQALLMWFEDILLFEDDTRVEYEPTEDAINVMTAHGSKGKEFPVVIIYDLNRFSDDEEDCRLLYVSMTRAKKNLIIMYSEGSAYIDLLKKGREHEDTIDRKRRVSDSEEEQRAVG